MASATIEIRIADLAANEGDLRKTLLAAGWTPPSDFAAPACQTVALGDIVAARPIAWRTDKHGQIDEPHYGFWITPRAPTDDPTEAAFMAGWGEDDCEGFDTLAEAQEWCQRLADGHVARVAVIATAHRDAWLPIESAPRSVADGRRVEGTYLLGFVPSAEAVDRQMQVDVIWWEPLMSNKAGTRGKWCASSFGDAVEVEPTHWQPLPKAPA